MQIFPQSQPREAVKALVEKIIQSLSESKVLWLVCGGSNISLAVSVMNELRSKVKNEDLKNLTVGLTDERYGPLGHKDSNWKQLLDAGFNTDSIKTIPVLTGKSLDETVQEYSRKLNLIFREDTLVIAQLGIGTDGHIAGVLPGTIGVSSKDLVCSYESEPYTRITLTLSALRKVSLAHAFVFGPSKKEIILRLKNENLSLDKMPAQILKQIPESYLYTDQSLKD